jgi:hypothetical protein
LRTSNLRKGATSDKDNQFDTESVAPEGPQRKGRFETYHAENISTDMSFLEMLDVVNEQLTLDGKEPIAFDHDCREGICGMCGCVVNGRPTAPKKGTTLCQLHMRHFDNGDTIAIEPFRAMAFKVIKDLAVDRSALDKIIQAGGYISANTGGAQDANAILVPQEAPTWPWTRPSASAAGPAWHRLPQRLGHAVCQRQDLPAGAAAPGQTRSGQTGHEPWCAPWTNWVSATAPTKGNAKPNAPRRSPSPTSPD